MKLATICLAVSFLMFQNCKSPNSQADQGARLLDAGVGQSVDSSGGALLSIACRSRNIVFVLQYRSSLSKGDQLFRDSSGRTFVDGTLQKPDVVMIGSNEHVVVTGKSANGRPIVFAFDFNGTKKGSGSYKGFRGEIPNFEGCGYDGALTSNGGAPIDEPISGYQPSTGKKQYNPECRSVALEIWCGYGGTTSVDCQAGEQRCR